MIDSKSPRTIPKLHAEMMAADPGCSLTMSALRRLVRIGAIRSCRVGAKYLVTHEAVSDFLSGNSPANSYPATVAAPGIRRVEL